MTALQHTSKRTWRKVENGRIGGKKLLVARNDEGGGEVYRWIQCMLKEQKSYGGSSRKAYA